MIDEEKRFYDFLMRNSTYGRFGNQCDLALVENKVTNSNKESTMDVETMRFKDLMKSPDEEATELMFWKFLIEGIQIQRPELTPLQASFFAAKFWHRAMVFNGDTTIEEAMEFSKLGGQLTEFFGTLKSFYLGCGMKKSFAKGGPYDEVFEEVNDFQLDMDAKL